MKCIDCCYFYHDLTPLGRPYGSPGCHFSGPEGWAPCEQEDFEPEEEDEEC